MRVLQRKYPVGMFILSCFVSYAENIFTDLCASWPPVHYSCCHILDPLVYLEPGLSSLDYDLWLTDGWVTIDSETSQC